MFLLGWIVVAAIGLDNPVVLVVPFLFLFGGLVLVLMMDDRRKKAQLSAERAAWIRTEIEKSEAEAKETCAQALAIRARLRASQQSLPAILENAEQLLRTAEADFRERAFSPFWDNVEEAARNLAAFNAGLVAIESGIRSYQQLLHGRTHNIPPLEDVPLLHPGRAIETFRRLVRMGQTDPESAAILEHRKTRQAIAEGFRTQGEAISNLGLRLSESIEQTTQVLAESSSRILEEQTKSREAFEDLAKRWEEGKRGYLQ